MDHAQGLRPRPLRLRIGALERHATNRKPGYLKACLDAGTQRGGFLEIEPDAYEAAKDSHPIKGIEQSDWPAWAWFAALLFVAPGDRGVGDTIVRELGEGEKFKAHHEAAFGVWKEPCACTGKARQWNQMFSYQ